jgi:hypothetical protein
VADHLCGTSPEPRFWLVSAHPPAHPKAMHQMRVIACEQHITVLMIISNIQRYLDYLRPDRDSNAGPTA